MGTKLINFFTYNKKINLTKSIEIHHLRNRAFKKILKKVKLKRYHHNTLYN